MSDQLPVTLTLFQWGEVCLSLQERLAWLDTKRASASYHDSLYALREIDRIMRGADEQAPPDDVLKRST